MLEKYIIINIYYDPLSAIILLIFFYPMVLYSTQIL